MTLKDKLKGKLKRWETKTRNYLKNRIEIGTLYITGGEIYEESRGSVAQLITVRGEIYSKTQIFPRIFDDNHITTYKLVTKDNQVYRGGLYGSNPFFNTSGEIEMSLYVNKVIAMLEERVSEGFPDEKFVPGFERARFEQLPPNCKWPIDSRKWKVEKKDVPFYLIGEIRNLSEDKNEYS